MFLISHRGNIDGLNPDKENHPDYITSAAKNHFNVEIDIRLVDNKWFLGHDLPQYEVAEDFVQNMANYGILWCHAKNGEAINRLVSDKKYQAWNYFWHQEDDYTLTSNGFVWTYPGKTILSNSICVLPEIANYDTIACAGICSDYIKNYIKASM